MVGCGLTNLGSCLVEKFFEFILLLLNAPVKFFLTLTLHLISEPIDLSLFSGVWAIIIYVLSMFYSLLILYSGFNFIISGYNSEKREKAKTWLRNVVIMVVLVQASFFIYQLAVDLSSIMTLATISLIDPEFFLITAESSASIGLDIIFSLFYVVTLLITNILLMIRYAFVAIGVVLFPLAIFMYFIPPLSSYGSLIANFLGISIFVTFFDAVILIGFSKLINIHLFAEAKILVMTSAFLLISIMMFAIMLFSIVDAGFRVYKSVRGGDK